MSSEDLEAATGVIREAASATRTRSLVRTRSIEQGWPRGSRGDRHPVIDSGRYAVVTKMTVEHWCG